MTPWKQAVPENDLHEGQVHLWRVGLDVPEPAFGRLREILSEEEVSRSERFRFPELQRRFAVGRAALRVVLAGYLAMEPARLRFGYTARGKPFLLDSPSALHFNISHSGGLMVAAACLAWPVGVDIEKKDSRVHVVEIAERFFCEGERELVARLHGEARLEAFFQIWTAKEAVLKATARGLAFELARVEIGLKPLRLVDWREAEGDSAASWHLVALRPAEEYCGTLAVAGHPSQIEWRELVQTL